MCQTHSLNLSLCFSCLFGFCSIGVQKTIQENIILLLKFPDWEKPISYFVWRKTTLLYIYIFEWPFIEVLIHH